MDCERMREDLENLSKYLPIAGHYMYGYSIEAITATI